MVKRRTSKRNREISDLNKRISKKKSNIKSRYGVSVDVPRIDPSLKGVELRKAKQRAKAFLDRNNENYQFTKIGGKAFSKAILKEAKQLEYTINRKKDQAGKKLLDKPYRVNGKVVGTVRSVLSVLKYEKQEFLKVNFDPSKFEDEKAFRKFLERKKDVYKGDFIRKQREQYKQNYIQGIINAFGYSTMTVPLLEQLNQMSPNELYEHTMSEDLTSFGFMYSNEEVEAKFNKLYDNWKEIL